MVCDYSSQKRSERHRGDRVSMRQRCKSVKRKQLEMEEDFPAPLTHECCMQSLSGSTANKAQTYAFLLVYMTEKLCLKTNKKKQGC